MNYFPTRMFGLLALSSLISARALTQPISEASLAPVSKSYVFLFLVVSSFLPYLLFQHNISLTLVFIAIPRVADYNNTRLYAQYAAAAYCNANNGGSINPTPQITCAGALMVNGGQSNQSNCPLVEAAGAATIIKFNLG
jgi:hypothetical protein